MKKTPLTLEDHAAQGRELKFIRDYLTAQTAILSRAYPLEVSHRGGLAADAVDFLRSVLDDQVARDYPGKDPKKLNAVYYPGDAAEETTPRNLKDAVSLAIHRLNDLLRPGLTEAYREPLEDVVALLREGLLLDLDAQGLGNAPA